METPKYIFTKAANFCQYIISYTVNFNLCTVHYGIYISFIHQQMHYY